MFFAWLVLTKESWAEECLYSKKQISTIKVQNISDHFRILIFIVCPGQDWKKRWGWGRRRGRRSVSWVGPSGKLPRALWRDQLALRWQNTHKFQQNCFPKWANRIPLLTRRTISTDLRSWKGLQSPCTKLIVSRRPLHTSMVSTSLGGIYIALVLRRDTYFKQNWKSRWIWLIGWYCVLRNQTSLI